MFENLFNTSSNLDRIQKSVNDHKVRVDNLITEINLGQSYKENYSDILLEMYDFSKIYIWKKNKNFLYEFANLLYCDDFLGLNIDKIYGLSDKEIFEKQKIKIKENFLYKNCLLTDNIIKKEKKECNFIEGNFSKNILYVKKKPIIKSKKFKGIMGIAQKYKNMNTIAKFLNKMIKNGNIKFISGKLDQNFCCQVFDQRINNDYFF